MAEEQATVGEAVQLVYESLLVLRTRDQYDLPTTVLLERARNIVCALGALGIALRHDGNYGSLTF